ncbi:tetratricopeptide repeat protein [Allocoprobacillus halotolerans]|uniref:Tetratricopeptide repeat protein n=1 Tax=Allocoprobacillus halotolerans TaxID=2944914 RepID=A0ABY5I409_9FIRM|nr:tetratricopeptide repeat protein [Allocoprobacillus halotolerans]UTY39815.1 tetratricopeptide repeat protein [Allocoprobacillus halotolerans]
MTIPELQKQLDQLYATNQLDQAYAFLLEQINTAMEYQDDLAILFLLNEMIGYFRVTSQFQLGNQIATQILNILAMSGREQTIDGATSYINIATFYRVQGRYQEALDLYQKTEKIYQQYLLPNDELYSAFYNNLSLLYQEMGDIHQAITMQKKPYPLLNN